MTDVLPLADRVPEVGFRDAGAALDAFLGWVADRGLTLYAHQEEAILELFDGKHVVLDAPTGSGKSLVATALLFKTFAETGRGWYTAPIKALVSEKFFELCRVFGAEHVGLMTGDGAVNPGAPILCCTAEILANRALREGAGLRAHAVVMDEFHYYADKDRGVAWQIPLLTLPKSTFLLMSATLGDTRVIRDDLERRTGRPVADVRGALRPVPLEFTYSTDPLHERLATLVRTGKAPVYVVHFTQAAATEQAQALMSVDWCTKEEKKAIGDAVRGFGFTSPFGPTLRRYVLHGVGLHHAGLLPRYRLLVERLAQQGLLKVICGTDTLGVGVNVPIRTVLFTQLCKFDGNDVGILPVREFRQIAGRAGRAGFDTVGYVVVQAPEHVVENLRITAAEAKNPAKKKKVKAQPPTRGYKHWDENTFQALTERPPEPLESRFSVDHGRLLSLMQHAEDETGDARIGVASLLELIDRCHSSDKRKVELRGQVAVLVESLVKAGVAREEGDRLHLDPTLQRDFSLHHSLSLFLLAAIATVEPSSPTWHTDVLSWVEAILEHPRPVLSAQVQRAKGELLARLKADGVPYEERQELLDEVTWPKPNGDAIYRFFDLYAEQHPWVAREAIRPKSIAREMAESLASFAEYVRTLGLERVEGVLLRYLSEVYKALVQNVPSEAWNDDFHDLVAWLRALLARVDSSLLTEWEALAAGADVAADATAPIDVSADSRAFRARIRAEMLQVVRALAARDFEDAAGGFANAADVDPATLEASLAPYFEAYGDVGFDHRARAAANTTVERVEPHVFTVRHRLFPPQRVTTDDWTIEGHTEEEDVGTFTIEGQVDLRTDTNPKGPLVQFVQISD